MKLISAVIQPFKLEEVREALTRVGVEGMTATEVKGFGQRMGHAELHRSSQYVIDFHPKLRVEAAVEKTLLDRPVDAIRAEARTGKAGDGKVFIFDITQAIRICTGETGRNAL
jgi:nitrogen regulatory protein P-II 2